MSRSTLVKAIADLLVAEGESLLDDHGVDEPVATDLAEAIAALLPDDKVAKVEVSGGCVQHVDVPPGMKVIVYDYDVDEKDGVDQDGDGTACHIAEW